MIYDPKYGVFALLGYISAAVDMGLGRSTLDGAAGDPLEQLELIDEQMKEFERQVGLQLPRPHGEILPAKRCG